MSYIEYHQGLRWHWKIERVATDLHIPQAHALGLVSALWLWCITNAPNGKNLKRFTDREIAAACGWEGPEALLRRSLRKHHWLDAPNDDVHEWDQYGLRILNLARARKRRYVETGGGDPQGWNAIRADVLARDSNRCRYCGKRATTVDHLIPRTHGGSTTMENLVACCYSCNVKKNNRTPTQAGMTLLNSPWNVPDGKKESKKERKTEGPSHTTGFEHFWIAYPRKVGREAAIRAWNRLDPTDELQGQLLSALRAQMRWPQWVKDGGQFIPHPATWLNGKRWEDREAERPRERSVVDDMTPEQRARLKELTSKVGG